MSLIFRNIGAVFLVFIVLGAFFVQSAAASDAVMAYRSASGSGTNFPKIKFWNSSASSGNGSWGSEIELPTSGNSLRQLAIKTSPVSNKIVLVTESSDLFLDAYVCMSNCANVSNWQVTNNIADASEATGSGDERRFDVAFEKTTGNAMVAYAVNSNNGSRDLGYKVLNAGASNFSGITEQYINDTTQSANIAYTWIRLDSKPAAGSNEMALAGFDYSNNTINAWVWNGSSWGNQVTVSSSATATGGNDALAVRYAADGSKAMVIGGNGTVGNVSGQYWNGASWTAANIGDINGASNNDVQWLTMKADPATDDLQAVAVDSGSSLHTAYWNGSAWNVTSNIDTIDSSTERPADFDWLRSGSTGRLVWDRDGNPGTTLSQRLCSPICNGSTSTVSAYAGSGNWIALFSNPTASDTVKILGLRLYTNGGNNPIGPFRFNGTNYTNYGDTNISADVGSGARESYSLAFLAGGDTTPPVVTLNSPYSGYFSNVSSIDFNFTATDDNSTTMNCSLYIDGVFNTANASVINNTPAVLTASLAPLAHNWSVSCKDQAGNTGNSATWNLTVAGNCPTVSSSYTMLNNFSGAPNNASEALPGAQACVKIAASNLVFNCNGYSITDNGTLATTYGILVNGSLRNITIKNCPLVSNYYYGVAVRTSNNVTIANVTAYNDSIGFSLFPASVNNSLTGNTAYGNYQFGYYITSGSNANVLTNDTAYNNPAGFALFQSDRNVFSGGQAYNNSNYGFSLYQSSGNNLTSCAAHDNSVYGFLLNATSENNSLVNNTAFDNGYANFALSSSNLNNLASNNATNLAVTWIYDFYLSGSNNNNLTNNIARNNNGATAIYLVSSNYNTLGGNNASNCNNGLFVLSGSASNNLTNNNANNGWGGFIAETGSDSNNFVSNNASADTIGFYLWSGSNNNMANNRAYNDTQYGVLIYNGATGNQFRNTTLYGNGYDLYVNSSTAITYNMTNTTFLNPSGTQENYTALYINDSVGAGESYSVSWSGQPAALPGASISFAQKFINITPLSGSVSLDSAVWSWQASELNASYNESVFGIWEYSSGSWSDTGATLNTTAHTLTRASLSPASVYGILQIPPNCVKVSTSYTMSNNFVGAPNGASEFGAGYLACVKITASNLVFDCNGYTILNNGTSNAIGIALNGTLTNVTIRNCPGINSYQYGVYAASVNNSVFRNNTLSDTSVDCFINNSFNNLLVNNSVSGGNGFQVYINSANNTVANNTIASCSYGIFVSSGATNNLLLNNTISNCFRGILLSASANYNNITANRISGSTEAAIVLSSGIAYNNVTGNTLSNNPGVGLELNFGTDADNFRDNVIYNNSMGIYFFAQITAEQFWNTVLYNNGYDIYANSSAVTSSYYMYNTSFRDPTGAAYNVTLNLSDTMGAGEIYSINWSANSTALPPDHFSFAQKYLDITARNGTVSIDSVVWGWLDSELSGYNESRFELWKYNASGWSKVTAARDTSANTLTVAGLNPGSVYGVLQSVPSLYINLTQPPEGSWSGVQNVTFGYIAVSNSDTLMNCSAYRDGAFNMTLPLYTNGTAANFSIAGLPEGRHNWSVACNDSTLANSSETRNFTVDLQAPSINLSAPAPGAYQDTAGVMFNYTPTDNLAPNMTCRLYVDSGLQGTFTVNNNTPRVDTYTLGEGFHTWYVACTDLAGNTGSTSARNFTVDLTPPSVQLNSPPNLYLTNNSAVTFNFTATDSLSLTMNCSVWVDGSVRAYNDAIANNTASAFTATIAEGQHNWYIQCTDLANNTDVSATRNMTVDLTPPSIALSAPLNTTRQNTTGVAFTYTPTDNFATSMSCGIYVDSSWQGTFTVSNNTMSSPQTYYFGSGNHTWYVSCTDQAGNTNTSGSRWFIIDLPPTVTLNAPADGTRIVSSDPVNETFNFTPRDDYSTTLNCTFYLDGLANYTNASLANGTPFALNATLSVTSHTWYVQCMDGMNSTGVSSTYNVIVSQTAAVQSSGGGEELKRFTLSASSSCPGDTADVYAYTSGGPLAGATVRAVLADPYEGLVGQDSTDSSGYVHITLPPVAGTYEFTALKAGYANPSMVSFSFTPCARPPEQNVTPPKPPPTGGNVTPPTNGTQPPPSNQTMGPAQQAISDAQSAISDAGAAGKDTSGARSKLDEAQAAFDAGNYQQALELANEAKQLALSAAAPVVPIKPTPPVTPTPTPTTPAAANPCPLSLILIGAVIVIALAAGAYMMFGRGRPRASRK